MLSAAKKIRGVIGGKEKLSLKEKILFSLTGAVVLGGSIYFFSRWWTKKKADREERKSIHEGSEADFANRIHQAIDDWGTDEEQLRQVLKEIPSLEMLRKVDKSFQKTDKDKRPLMKALKEELSISEFEEMRAILFSKPERAAAGSKPYHDSRKWAIRLKAAFDKTYGFIPGTDEEAIRVVFSEIPSQAAFVEVGKEYEKVYGRNLIADLKSELEFWEYGDYMKMITSKPKV